MLPTAQTILTTKGNARECLVEALTTEADSLYGRRRRPTTAPLWRAGIRRAGEVKRRLVG